MSGKLCLLHVKFLKRDGFVWWRRGCENPHGAAVGDQTAGHLLRFEQVRNVDLCQIVGRSPSDFVVQVLLFYSFVYVFWRLMPVLECLIDCTFVTCF